MNKESMVVIGFCNHRGQLTHKIIEEEYRVIERLNQRPKTGVPIVKAAKFSSIDMNYFKNLLSHRRNQTLIKNFISTSEETDITQLLEVKKFAQKASASIGQELKMTSLIAADFNLNKFMSQTRCDEQTGHAYMAEFNNNVERAVEKYRERDTIVRNFANRNNMEYENALGILRENGYNASLFD